MENEHEPTEMKLLGGKCQKCYGTLPGTVFNPRKDVIDYKEHQLADGDTLEGLAIRYDVKVEELKRINAIWNSKELFLRDSIKIPVTSSELVGK